MRIANSWMGVCLFSLQTARSSPALSIAMAASQTPKVSEAALRLSSQSERERCFQETVLNCIAEMGIEQAKQGLV